LGGWLPGVAIGPFVGIGLRPFKAMLVEVDGSFFPPLSEAGPNGQGSVSASAAGAHARACGVLGGESLSALACFGGGWLALFARGKDVENASRGDHHSGEIGALLSGAWHPSRRFSLYIGGSLTLPFQGGVLAFARAEDLIQVHETNRSLGGGRLGLAFLF
jgi:hypothetical protein